MFPATVIKVKKYMIGTPSTKSKFTPCNQFMWYDHLFIYINTFFGNNCKHRKDKTCFKERNSPFAIVSLKT